MRHGRAIRAGVVVATMLSISLSVPGAAYADTTCNPNIGHHCYSMVQSGGVGSAYRYLGDLVEIKSSCLATTDGIQNFVTNETWMAEYVSGSTRYWIETGEAYGNPQGNRRYFYWADSRPGHSYSEHDDTSSSTPALGTNYESYIDQSSSTSYYVEAGPWTGSSTAWPSGYTFNTLQTGSETEDHGAGVAERGESSGLEYYSKYNNLDSGWPGVTHAPNPSNWGTVSTVTSGHAYDINVTSSCAAPSKSGGASRPVASSATSPRPGHPTVTDEIAAFKRQAKLDANGHAFASSYVVTSADLAEQGLYGSSPADRAAEQGSAHASVIVLNASGTQFVAQNAKTPAGAAAPTGSTFTEVVSLANGRIMDWGVSRGARNLATLGTVHRI